MEQQPGPSGFLLGNAVASGRAEFRGKKAIGKVRKARKNKATKQAASAQPSASTMLITYQSPSEMATANARRSRIAGKRKRANENRVNSGAILTPANLQGFNQSGVPLNQSAVIMTEAGEMKGVLSPNQLSFFPLKPAKRTRINTFKNVAASVVVAPFTVVGRGLQRTLAKGRVNDARNRRTRMMKTSVSTNFMNKIGARYRSINRYNKLATEEPDPSRKRELRRKQQEARNQIPILVRAEVERIKSHTGSRQVPRSSITKNIKNAVRKQFPSLARFI